MVMVGAGLTGLAAARALTRAGVTVGVVEAQGEAGGRVKTVRAGGVVAEAGAQFFNRDMSLLTALVRQSGVACVELPTRRARLQLTAGGSDEVSELDPVALLPDPASVRDEQPLSATLAGVAPASRAGVESMLLELSGRPLDELSLRAALTAAMTFDSSAPAEETAITGGMDRVVALLAEGTEPWLECPAHLVRVAGDSVVVHTARGELRARAVLIAAPPTAAAKLQYEPRLPQRLRDALDAFLGGDMIKVTLDAERPFWRIDERPADFISETPGVTALELSPSRLVVFMGGPAARRAHALAPGEREAFVRHAMHAGRTAARMSEGDWVGHRWCGGGYNSWVRFGAAVDSAATVSVGAPPLFFASSELSTRFAGYMEGALHAGEAQARRMLEWLR